MKEYLIKKILSNNVVLVEKNQKNYVLVGKGIGFGKKKGVFLEDLKEIEEKFISLEGLNDVEYEHFLETVDPKIIELCNRIIEMVSLELGENLNPKIHAGLIDHVNLAIKRLREGIEIVNPFLFETRLLYPVEYELAEKAVFILKENLQINIPEAEIGFLALHLYGGRGNNDKEEALKHSKMMNRILSHIGKKLEIDMDKYPFDCQRLIMHLRGVINRVEKNQCIEKNFVSKLKDELRYEFKVAYDISKIMEKTLKLKVPESEVGYIALHLHKLNSYKH
ncbi:BglG family transcription antiterminator [Geosporobacter ferrireducens]|uniref:Antiterminator n=1 Tax=Geosporobacter ferrireducens TaxID=1424294 RepID=A0A1D8GNS0_9FIRM|nr:PRD domain-containing protein [Geosporobacter ferrireducens]AOT72522.1 antiterminator [Geosporobacter ferrireducens]MTI58180.1 PRD domain-containing protein [Geosporobacter ferrireducens]